MADNRNELALPDLQVEFFDDGDGPLLCRIDLRDLREFDVAIGMRRKRNGHCNAFKAGLVLTAGIGPHARQRDNLCIASGLSLIHI